MLTPEGFEKVDQKCLERYHKELAALSHAFPRLPTTREMAGALHMLDERHGNKLTKHLFERSSKVAFYKYEAEKLQQLYTYCARMMRRTAHSRSVSISILQREWNDHAESPFTSAAERSPTMPAILDRSSSEVICSRGESQSQSQSQSIENDQPLRELVVDSPWPLPDDSPSPLPDYPVTDDDAIYISVSESDDCVQPFPSAGSAAADESDLTIDVKDQRKQTKRTAMKKPAASMKKRPAASVRKLSSKMKAPAPAPPAKNASAPAPPPKEASASAPAPAPGPAPGQHIAKSHLRLVFKVERGKRFWAIKYGNQQLMQVTVDKAGSIDKAKHVGTFLINMFDSSTLEAVREARRRLLDGETVVHKGLLCNIDDLDVANSLEAN